MRHVEWNIAADCQSPVTIEIIGRRYTDRPDYGPQKGIAVTLEAKCRKCENCLKKRASHWRLRALSEYGQSNRSWLVTLTFRPEFLHRALSRCRWNVGYAKERKKGQQQSIDFDTLPDGEKFRLLERETGKEVTLFLKRLRKKNSFRYFLVCERHESGMPHYHLVVNEPAQPVTHKSLKAAWSAGFLDAKLIADSRQATYACKYLTKTSLTRVRASANYGSGAADYALNGIAAGGKLESSVEPSHSVALRAEALQRNCVPWSCKSSDLNQNGEVTFKTSPLELATDALSNLAQLLPGTLVAGEAQTFSPSRQSREKVEGST